MNSVITPEMRDVIEAVHYRPAVSIIMPYNTRISLKKELAQSLKTAADKVEKELRSLYPEDIAVVVIKKLRNILKDLRYETEKKSIAIYVSPIFQKVIYLDIPVEEKIIVDESFEIRDLLYSKKQLHKYLVLLLSTHESRMYLGNTVTFIRIVSDIPESVYDVMNELPEKGASPTDITSRKEKMMERFIQHVDIGLDSMLKIYDLPLFVIGNERMIANFKGLSKHGPSVIEYIQGNFEEAGLSRLKELMASHVKDWQRKKQSELLLILEQAADRDELVYGMSNVWAEAMSHRGRLLIVEKDYMYAAEHGANNKEILPENERSNKLTAVRDAVDDLIEMVLKDGGDVEFVEKDGLKDYDQIALIKYF